MSIVIHQLNPLDPAEREVEVLEHPLSIRHLLLKRGIGEFAALTICLVNGKPVLRKDWSTVVLYKADICIFQTLPRGGGGGGGGSNALRIVLAIVVIIIVALVTYGVGAAAAAGSLGAAFGAGGTATLAGAALAGVAGAAVGVGLNVLINTFLPVEGPENKDFDTSPTYSIFAQNNLARLGAPIPVQYGRVKFHPDLVAQPFSYYWERVEESVVEYTVGNITRTFVSDRKVEDMQRLEMLFCLGQGQFDVHEVRVGDVLIQDIPEAEHEILPPGTPPTLAPSAVYYATGVSNLSVESTDYIGPFPVNPPGTTVDVIGFNVSMPQGVYEVDTKNGGYNSHSLSGVLEYQPIDDTGAALGAWTAHPTTFAPSSKGETKPRHKNYQFNVPSGRYQVRLKRDTPLHTNNKKFDYLVWVNAYGKDTQNHPDYGNVTLMAVRMIANERLSGLSSRRISVLATRKIRKWDGTWTGYIPSRSAIWAMADILMAPYGGNMQDSALDLTMLKEADLFADNQVYKFDYRYDTNSTLMEAATLAAASVRVRMYMQGGVIRAVADQAPVLPLALYTPENIVKDSLSIDFALPVDQPHDSLEVEYFSEHSWQFKTVTCALPGVTPQRPRRMRLPGVQQHNQAYELGMYHLASDRYRRVHISFETGLEGHIPSIGDPVLVSYDLVDWTASGTLYGLFGTTLVLSDPVDFKGQADARMRIRMPDGIPSVEFVVLPGDNPYQVVLQDPASIDLTTAHFANNHQGRDPTPYIFGLTSTTQKQCKVISVAPATDMRIKITTVVDDLNVYAAPEGIPVDQSGPFEPIPGTGFKFTDLRVRPLSAYAWAYRLSWLGAGYDKYVIFLSYDNTNFKPADVTERLYWDMLVSDPLEPKPVNAYVVPVWNGHLYYNHAMYLYDTNTGHTGQQGHIEVIGAPQGLEVL